MYSMRRIIASPILRTLSIIVLIYSFILFGTIFVLTVPVVADTIIEIRPGTSLTALSKALEKKGLIRSAFEFKVLGRLLGSDKAIKAGQYTVKSNYSMYNLLSILVNGEVNQYSFTIIEGLTFKQVYEQMQSHPQIKKTPFGLVAYNSGKLKLKGVPQPLNLEGVLLPETYNFEANTKDIELIVRAYNDMNKFLSKQWQKRGYDAAVKSPYEALVLASIVEKETSVDHEFSKVASVYNNRLQKNWRLQADPTVVYAIGKEHGYILSRKDLKTKSKFNTYMNKGLPPTPIAMPGKRAIIAALNPEPSDDMYFVSDGKGGHIFSKTYEDHLAAVRSFRQSS